jgi:D-apiose dehydrogenase
MSHPIRLAVIGAGYFSRFHFDAWERIPEVEIVGICDRDPARLTELQQRFPKAQISSDPQALLKQVRPDWVDIITPADTHLELVRLAAQEGIHVICQKALAPDFEEAKAVVEVAERAGITLVVHENFRFQPWYRESKRLLEAGLLGEPLGVMYRLRTGDGRGPRAYLDRQPYFQQMPRLLVHETAVHLIDTFRYLMGEVTAVAAHLRRINPVIVGEDAGVILFEFASSSTGVFDGNRHIDHEADEQRLTMGFFILEGSEAQLRLDGFGRLWLKPHGQPEREHPFTWQPIGFGADCVYNLQRHVIDHLLHHTPLENTGKAYLRNLEIEEAVYQAHQERRWIGL